MRVFLSAVTVCSGIVTLGDAASLAPLSAGTVTTLGDVVLFEIAGCSPCAVDMRVSLSATMVCG